MCIPVGTLINSAQRAYRNSRCFDNLRHGIQRAVEFDVSFPAGCYVAREFVYLFVREGEVDRISQKKGVQTQHCGALIPVAEDVAASEVDEEVSSFGRERGIQFAAKDFLIRLLSR